MPAPCDLLAACARPPAPSAATGDHLGLLLVAAVHAEQHRQPALGGEPDGGRRGAGDDDLGAPGPSPRPRAVSASRARYDGDLAEGVPLARRADTRARAASAAAGRAIPGSRFSYASRPLPKTSRSTHGPPRPTPSVNRPPEVRCSSAACSPRATGWAVGSTLTAVPTPIRRVRPEQQGRQGHRRGADAVRDEVVLGEPDGVEPGLLGHLGGPHRPVQRLPLPLARELGGQNKAPTRIALPPWRRRGLPHGQQRLTRAKGTAWQEDCWIF